MVHVLGIVTAPQRDNGRRPAFPVRRHAVQDGMCRVPQQRRDDVCDDDKDQDYYDDNSEDDNADGSNEDEEVLCKADFAKLESSC